MERKGKVIPCKEDRKGMRTNSGEFGVRNLQAESIRSSAESMGGCVAIDNALETVINLSLIHI